MKVKVKMKLIVLLILFILLLLKNTKKSKLSITSGYCPVVKAPSFLTVVDPINDISIKQVGCFTNISDLFFMSCINPYSTQKIPDSGINISVYPNDIKKLINNVINNGYDIYGNKILNKYKGTDYSNLSLLEISSLGYLQGYRYISVSSNNSNQIQIFLSYSPPMNDLVSDSNNATSDLVDYTLTPKLNNYTNENKTTPGTELSCGLPCLQNGKPQTNSNGTKHYMCGSTAYPTIKTPSRYAVYQIIEQS